MNSPPSNSEARSSSFELLDQRIQRWIWQAGWTQLKDAQEQAIPLILGGQDDIIIAAATASGKTEAAFFPILTRLLASETPQCVLYVSPLKALINDQWLRLEQLCESLEIPVVPWHGDIVDSRKKRFLKNPSGCLLITPESLEGLLLRRGHALGGVLGALAYVVIDELHAFIDTERGKQLQSLLHRIDYVLERNIPRIALSATLGEMHLAAEFLRPGGGARVRIIDSKSAGQELKVVVHGYYDLPPRVSAEMEAVQRKEGIETRWEDTIPEGVVSIGAELYRTLRGTNNLVFPNSRNRVEFFADLLRRQCERECVPNEFFPHHGSLAKDIREETEHALKAGDRPVTAIATTTLELGIDIGAVKSIAQIGPAPSVASLRQRLGRSGRRGGEPAILRCYCLESEIDAQMPVSDQLRVELVQTIAHIRLLVAGWFEPPQTQCLHLSTLIQQLLSLVAQYGGITAQRAWSILCESGVFGGLSRADFIECLRELGKREVLMQDSSGLLLHGALGERLVNHYSFLAAFSADEEFRVVCAGRTLGTLPISRPVVPQSYIIFAGRRWLVRSCIQEEKLIEVEPAQGGRPPLFDGMSGKTQDRVREEMRIVLSGPLSIPFLDATATKQLEEGRNAYAAMNLHSKAVIVSGREVRIFTWCGDWINDTLALMLSQYRLKVTNEGICLCVHDADSDLVRDGLEEIAREPAPAPEDLARSVDSKIREKWDGLLTEELLARTFASRELDVPGAVATARRLAEL